MDVGTGKTIYTVPVPVAAAAKALPDPTQPVDSKQIQATLGDRNAFTGWWPLLQQHGMLKTEHSRIIGNQGIPGNCNSTLRSQMAGLQWRVITRDTREETDETKYYSLVLGNARDQHGAQIGAAGLFDLVAQDVLNSHEAGNAEVVRIRGGRYDGVPIALYAVDAASLRWLPRGAEDPEPIAQINPDSLLPIHGGGGAEVRFAQDEIMHVVWSRYQSGGLQWYNRHPVQMAWVAINCLAAGDDYNYSLLTEVIPQGLLNLGPGFDRTKAMQWRDAWRAARQSGKLEDIGLLWGTEKVEFIRFNQALTEQPYQHMAYWYLTTVTGAYGMSPLDIGFMTQLNTKAGAEVSVELSKNKGLAHLLRVIGQGVEFWILPEHLALDWPDLDPTDEQVEAGTREANSRAITTAFAAGLGWITQQEARAESVRLGVFDLDVDEEVPQVGDQDEAEEDDTGEKDDTGDEETETEDTEKEGEETEAEEEVAAALSPYLAKSHIPKVVSMTCPLCGFDKVNQFDATHGNLCVCIGCGCTFDPEVESVPMTLTLGVGNLE